MHVCMYVAESAGPADDLWGCDQGRAVAAAGDEGFGRQLQLQCMC